MVEIPAPIEREVTSTFILLECPICHYVVGAETYRASYMRYRIHLCSKHNIC